MSNSLKLRMAATTALSGLASCMLFAAPAAAQQAAGAERPASSAGEAERRDVEEVLVTGSRIRGATNTTTPAPVTMVSVEDRGLPRRPWSRARAWWCWSHRGCGTL